VSSIHKNAEKDLRFKYLPSENPKNVFCPFPHFKLWFFKAVNLHDFKENQNNIFCFLICRNRINIFAAVYEQQRIS
jgi:hypothetical protein